MLPAFLIALAFLASPRASAAPPERPLPEDEARGDHFTQGLCSVEAFQGSVEVPAPKIPDDPHIPKNWKDAVEKAALDGRARIVAVRRLTHRLQMDATEITAATNECGDAPWDRLEVLISTAEAGARAMAEAALDPWLRPGDRRRAWTMVRADQEPARPVPPGRYADACRPRALDADLYAPEAPALTPEARAKLAEIGKTASLVTRSLLDQKRALDDLLPLLDGARCRETLAAFDALADAERRQYFDYREKAVAGAVWSGLTWKKASP